MLNVFVAYATPAQTFEIPLSVHPGCTASEAILQSGLLAQCPEINESTAMIGIHGRKVSRTALLKAGDRVEIYRPLKIDPKQARRQRAAARRRP